MLIYFINQIQVIQKKGYLIPEVNEHYYDIPENFIVTRAIASGMILSPFSTPAAGES